MQYEYLAAMDKHLLVSQSPTKRNLLMKHYLRKCFDCNTLGIQQTWCICVVKHQLCKPGTAGVLEICFLVPNEFAVPDLEYINLPTPCRHHGGVGWVGSTWLA